MTEDRGQRTEGARRWLRREVIGDATLYLGDCLAVLPTLGAVDFIFCDPPYGHNNNSHGDLIQRWEKALGREASEVTARAIMNDGAEAQPLYESMLKAARQILDKGGACCCCCCGGGPDPMFARWSLIMDEIFDFKQMVVWDKGPMGMGWHYRRSYEVVLVGQVPGAACRWFDESNAIENIIRPGYRGIKKIIPSAEQHPTEKPAALAGHFIALHSLPGELVCDPFMGSGSTGIAAIEAGRRFVGIELDPQFFDMACERIAAAQRQGRLFDAAPLAPAPVQEAMEL